MSESTTVAREFDFGSVDDDLLLQVSLPNTDPVWEMLEKLDKLPRPNWPDERIVRGIKALDPWALADQFGDTLESIYKAVGEYLFKFEDADGCLVVVDTLAEWFVIVPIEVDTCRE